MRRARAVVLAVSMVVPVSGSCGGDTGAPTGGSAGTTLVTGAPEPSSTIEGNGAGDGPGGDQVAIATFTFRPGTTTVVAGTTVTWSNGDDVLHTVTAGTPDSPAGGFDLELDGKGTTATHEFATAGTFPYFCRRHPSMTGSVTVT